MNPVLRVAAAAAVAALLAVGAPLSAAAAPPDQWWTDDFKLGKVHKTTQGEGAIVCVIDGAINADVSEFDGADLQLKSAVPKGGGDTLAKAQSHPSAFYAGHGTSMASLISGQGKGTGPNGSGVAGMAPKATVYFYQGNSDPITPEYENSNFDALLLQGLDDGCMIFSISIANVRVGTETLDRLNEEDSVVLWGGRHLEFDSPSDGGVLIGAADRDGKPWDGDMQPRYPDVIAPGVDIMSGGMKGTVATNSRWVSNLINTGSSEATAITAGVLALVKSRYPDATGNQLIQALIHAGGGKDYWGAAKESGWGPIWLKDMLERDPSGWPDINPMLMNRQSVYDKFPQSSWQDPNAKTTTNKQDRTDTSTAALATDRQDDDGGLPRWAWIAGGLILIGGTGATVIAARRRTTSPTNSQAADSAPEADE